MQQEIDSIDQVLNKGQNPVTAIIGGSKVSTKISILENVLDSVNHIIIGGGMIFTFIKALGGSVGSSLVEDDYLEMAKSILLNAQSKQVTIHLPTDVLCSNEFSNNGTISTENVYSIPSGLMGLDIGPKTIVDYLSVISASKTILWNGPMGVFEFSNFSNGTKQIGLSVAKATQSGSFSLVGGGDSVAAVNMFNLNDSISYISTGGGAMLEVLEGKELPGISAINS
jgi:phosphoglycerate kinase